MEENQLLSGLNSEQVQAVIHKDGPLLIVAGAGTGKTTVITRRIAWLIDQGLCQPENILALTFTDKAAGEMEERVDRLLPYGYVDIQISTFHSFCERILREHGAEIGLARDFKVASELDAWMLARKQFDRFELDYYRPLGNPTRYIKSLLTHFSRAKDNAVFPQDYIDFAQGLVADGDNTNSDELAESHVKKWAELANAYHTYQQILLENDFLDFGDLLLITLKLLRERPHVLSEIREKYKYVLVDEFQDTNFAQYEIIKAIAGLKNNITVVGDDDQSIYKFRGASITNILLFKHDYPDVKTVVLNQNYRSCQSILDTAYNFIQKNNPNRLEAQMPDELSKKLLSNLEGAGMVEHINCDTLENEAQTVAEKIIEIKNRNNEISWNDFVILVRSNDSANDFLPALEEQGIPYQFLALRGLYTKSIIVDILSYLRAIDNPHHSPSVYRVLTNPMNAISPMVISELNHLAKMKGKSLFQACSLAGAFTKLPEDELKKVNDVISFIQKMQHEMKQMKSSGFFVSVARDSGLVAYINSQSEKEKQDNFGFLQQFYEKTKRFDKASDHPHMHEFLSEFEHETESGEQGQLNFDFSVGPEVVRVMTVHAAKGLEFKYVFIVNMIDQRFPTSKRADAILLPPELVKEDITNEDWHIQEERRLFYVAITRAKEGVFFTSAQDYGGARKRKISRFIHELDIEVGPEFEKDSTDFSLEKPNNEKEMKNDPIVYQIPKYFSFTQLAAFRSCPLQYKFAHILGIPVFGKWTFSFGKTMHNTLQEFFSIWVERTAQKQTSLFAEELSSSLTTGKSEGEVGEPDKLPVSLSELETTYRNAWQDDWYTSDAQREEYRENGLKSIREYYAMIMKQRPEPFFLEQGFTLKFDGVILKGRIDRIDRCEEGVEIIDYKTGNAKTLESLKKEDKEQLLLYQIAAKEILKLNPKKLTFHYLSDNSQVSFLGTQEELDILKNTIEERVDQIKNSSFEAKPGFDCKYCDFADICEYRQH
ncbi:MAG: ATP-dependent DNA helicase [Patescibacteria group bacterium]